MGDEAASGASKLYIPMSEGAAVGQEVECSVKGTVASLEGDVMCITPSEIDGMPAPMAPAEEAPASDHDMLEQQAMDEDKLSGGY